MPGAKPAVPLTERETEVTAAIARGRTNQEIGAELFISLSTVKTHVASIQMKLALRNRVEIAAWAWEHRLAGPGYPLSGRRLRLESRAAAPPPRIQGGAPASYPIFPASV
jgi:DNA-binding CsgD family transcriptional regulator